MPYVNILVHLVFSTKHGKPLITKELKPLLIEHIRQNAIEKNIFLDRVNCMEDHIHLLISLGADQSIATVAKLLKGESSHWVNKQGLVSAKFEWQGSYWAASIAKRDIFRVREYIEKQEQRHMERTFERELNEYMIELGEKNGFGFEPAN